jgi:hypothetical protein
MVLLNEVILQQLLESSMANWNVMVDQELVISKHG